MQSVISSPPTASFTAESTLQLSVVPISQMENSAADDNSGVSASPPLNVRSDSTASYGSLFSPSSSSSSVHMKAGFSRELSRDSFDSISSAENFTRDPEDSLRVRASSTSDRQYNFGRPPSSQPQQRQIQDAISTLPPVPENPPKFGESTALVCIEFHRVCIKMCACSIGIIMLLKFDNSTEKHNESVYCTLNCPNTVQTLKTK